VKRTRYQWFVHWVSEALSLVLVALICFLIGAGAMHIWQLIFWR
jgi:hypothetical protein